MSDFTPAQIEAGIEALSKVNWSSALATVKAANVQGILSSLESIADVLSPIIPGAIDVEYAMDALSLIYAMQQAGWIKPADPETNRAMINAAGHGGLGQDHT